MDEVAENSDELMERYLEGEEISHEEIVTALKKGVTEGHLFPVTCGVATKNLGTNRLLEALVEDVPSPAMRGASRRSTPTASEIEIEPDRGRRARRLRLQDHRRPLHGPDQPAARLLGRAALRLAGLQRHPQGEGADRPARRRRAARRRSTVDELGAGRHRRGRQAARDARRRRARGQGREHLVPAARPAGAGDGVRLRAEVEGRRGEGGERASAASTEEDPTLDVHRDPQTGEQIIAGLTQVHVEVIVDRMKRRYGAEIELHPPQVPYLETIRKPAKAHGRYKKQTGGRGQFGDCHIEIEPAEAGAGFEFVNAIKGGVIPGGFIPAVEKGIAEAMQHGVLAGYPMKDVRVRLYDGQHHSVDSSEMAFKIAGSMAFKQAAAEADPYLLEPIVQMTIAVPEDAVGDVVGDLNSRRGRPLGMEPKGSVTEIKAEVPMAEVLDYAPDLRAITGGRGDYTMEFERYEEVPAHIAQKVIAEAQAEDEEQVKA